MPRSLFLLLISCLLGYSLAAQQTKAEDPATWWKKIQQGQADTSQVRRLLELGNYYFLKPGRTQSQWDTSVLLVSKAQALAEKLNYVTGEGKAFILWSRLYKAVDPKMAKGFGSRADKLLTDSKSFTDLGYGLYEISNDYNPWTSESADKIKLIARSVTAFHKAGNLKKEADALKELADVRQITGDLAQSMVELKQALFIYQKINETHLKNIYDLMGDVSCSLGDLNEAVKYGLLAEQAAAKAGDTSLELCTIYNHLGITYYYLKDFNAAASYYKKALSIAEKYNSYNDIYLIAINYGKILTQMGKPAECNHHLQLILTKYPNIDSIRLIHYTCIFVTNYAALKDFDKADQYYHQLLQLTKDRFIPGETQRSIYNAITGYLLASGQYTRARSYLEKEEQFLRKNSSLLHLARNQLSWISLDSALDDPKSAYRHFRIYSALKDSIYAQEKNKYIAQLGVQYDIQKKDQDIQLKEKNIQLLGQKAKLQTAQLSQARQSRNWILGASILLVIIIGLLVNYSRLKQRTNQKLRSQQKQIEKNNDTLQHLVMEKEWLVKEIHHRVKNNFHIVQGLLGTQSGYLKSEEAITALADSRHRVQAMALIHQRLYQSDNLSAINMVEYIHELVNHLRDSFRIRTSIQFQLDIDPIELDLSHCIPLGLILNEAITNSIKYAFPDERQGIIRISLEKFSPDKIALDIEDNGVGLADNYNVHRPTSMGMRLIKGLSEDIEASLLVSSNAGTKIHLEFEYDFNSNNLFRDKAELIHTL